MKKLLILIVIISGTSFVNASCLIMVDDVINPNPITMLPSNTATIGIYATEYFQPPFYDVWLVCQGPGIISGGQMLYQGSLTELETKAVQDWEEGNPGLFNELGYPGTTSASYALFADGVVPSVFPIGMLVDNIIFHCEGYGEVLLTLCSGDFTTVYDTQTIQQVPEPASAVIFTVGLIFVASKRKKRRLE